MTLSAAHGGQTPFLHATRSSGPRFQTFNPRIVRYVRLAASGGFHSDHVGASSSTDATAAPATTSSSTGGSPPLNAALLHLTSFFGYLRGNASSLAQHLHNTHHESFLPSLRLQLGTRVRLTDGGGASEEGKEGVGSPFHSLQLPSPVPHVRLRHARTKSEPSHKQHEEEQHKEKPVADNDQKLDDAQLLFAVILNRIPWSYRISPHSTDCEGTGSPQAAFPASPPLHSQLRYGGMYQGSAAHVLGMAVLWHSAVSLQQRVVVTALWHVGQAVEVADKARKNLPTASEVPGLVHWGAVAAAACAEETVALALAHTATVASVAASGVPAAAGPVVSAPHLPVLHHARARLLSAAKSTLERLRGLQRGCTTHVLLRFLLFSALNPRLRRDLRVRLDVLSRRAAQVAILQEQHDAWLSRQLVTPLAVITSSTGANGHTPTTSSVVGAVEAHGSSTLTPSPSSSSSVSLAPLAARWYRQVFAPEMLACVRQLELESPSCPPDDRTAGDPPGRFDLRDLYRLIRVVEVAVEDLERYN